MSSENLIKALKITLADSYILYLKIQNFHWNVVGQEFKAVHLLLEDYYNELAELNDELAERLRALNTVAPGSFKEFTALTNIKEISGKEINFREVLQVVLKDKETFLKTVDKTLKEARKADDYGTEDIMIGISKSTQKQIWMLRSMLK